tara:strand:- start:196 stop:696 length:501 start_codon:yes stop_codon:yes gene_type:complete
MSIYNITFRDFVIDQLPVDKREPVNIAFFTALLKPLETLHESTFNAYRTDIIGRSKQNGQRILFESILNTNFGVNSAPFIYIDNSGDNITPLSFYNQAEGLAPTYLYNITEGQPSLFFNNVSEVSSNRDFIVYVPTAVYSTAGEIPLRQQIDRLKPYSTNYTIITY